MTIKTLADFDWHFNPKLPKTKLVALASARFVQTHGSVLLIRPPGVGKSHVATAAAYTRTGHHVHPPPNKQSAAPVAAPAAPGTIGRCVGYTIRFALYVGKQCHGASIKAVATDLHLDWPAVNEMDKLYLRAQLARAGNPQPAMIGIDELFIRKGHVYRIVVSDLERGETIWFDGVDGSEASLVMFYDVLGVRHTKRIRHAVMDT